MHTPLKKTLTGLSIATFGLLAGCSTIVKSTVNSQPIVEIKDTQYANPDEIVEGKAVFYTPTEQNNQVDTDLARFSPVLVQGFQPAKKDGKKYKYDYTQDAIGAPYLIHEGRDVRIDTDKPVMFCRVEQAHIYGQKLKQLVYVWWYPSRPVGSIEKGQVDGNILRITLDRESRPVVFEYSQTCGCYHGVFASSDLEQLARREFQQPLEGKRFALEKIQSDKADWVIRDLIDVKPDQRLFVYVSAGRHFGKALRFMDIDAAAPENQKTYQLAEYESLVHIPTDEGTTASMFNDDGLVKGAKRTGEEIMLADLDHPGWPRHLDRMLIHWDQDRWSDPKLLAEALRVPHQAVVDTEITPVTAAADGQAAWSMSKPGLTQAPTPDTGSSMTSAHVTTQEGSASGNGDVNHNLPDELYKKSPHDKPFLVLVSHKYCIGCQAFKKDVLPLPDVRHELEHWNFISLDMFIKDQMLIAKQMNITLTPTIICYDTQGHELRRIEGIDSKDQLMKFISTDNLNMASKRLSVDPKNASKPVL